MIKMGKKGMEKKRKSKGRKGNKWGRKWEGIVRGGDEMRGKVEGKTVEMKGKERRR